MLLSAHFGDATRRLALSQTSILIGRARAGQETPDLDLAPDRTVSRRHARLFLDGDSWFLEDLGSTHGTLLEGRPLAPHDPQIVRAGQSFSCGETILTLLENTPKHAEIAPEKPKFPPQNSQIQPQNSPRDPISSAFSFKEIEAETIAHVFSGEATKSLHNGADLSHLKPLFDVFLGAENLRSGEELDALLREAVRLIVEAIAGARRGALLLHSHETDTLLLAAFHGDGGPAVSETLARQVLREKRATLWRGEIEGQLSASQDSFAPSLAQFTISSAALAPLLWNGNALGVLCVDNPAGAPFSQGDLYLLDIVAHQLALLLANRRLLDDLRRETNLKSNLLRQFSPQYREQLLNPSGLKFTGERGEVTILVCDIRGFEAIARGMEPVAVIEMLNDYFSRLSPIIWAHNGSIDKYIGDAILAVFGSPNKDPKQHENALRAAHDMQLEMQKSNDARAKKGKVTCEIGIGVHCGEALHGFMGVLDQFSLTVIGDAVNRASRYCDGARGGQIVFSPQIYQWVWKEIRAAPLQITTKHGEMLPAFELLGFS